jgi:hypothetical protein
MSLVEAVEPGLIVKGLLVVRPPSDHITAICKSQCLGLISAPLTVIPCRL